MQSGKTPTIPDYFQDVQDPTANDLFYQIEQLVQQGALSPQDAQAFLVEQSAMQNVQSDPGTKQAQMDALLGLQDVTNNKGLTAQDRSNLAQIQREEATRAKGSRDAILQNAQARGAGGSGMEILAQLQNQQEATNRASQRDLDVAGMSQQRALQALQQQGQLAGNINQQDFNQQATKANALDNIAQFNAQNRQQVGLANTQARNQADATNLQNSQNTANANASLRTAQNQQQANTAQQIFDNKLKKRTGQQGTATNNAQLQGQASQNQANTFNQMLGSGLTAGAYLLSDETQKENVEDFDASDFLNSLTAHKYNYKDAKHGKGSQVGVMAQDLMKSEAGKQLVESGDEGLMINTSKAVGPLLASAADLNKRLKKLEGK